MPLPIVFYTGRQSRAKVVGPRLRTTPWLASRVVAANSCLSALTSDGSFPIPSHGLALGSGGHGTHLYWYRAASGKYTARGLRSSVAECCAKSYPGASMVAVLMAASGPLPVTVTA